jgi:CRP-like cAMP-binding protein
VVTHAGDLPLPRIENRLLSTLPQEAAARLLGHLEHVSLKPGDTLCEPGAHSAHVYFPGSCLVSLQYVGAGGPAVEFGVVGMDGVVGIDRVLGPPSIHHAVVQIGGSAVRIGAAALDESMPRLEGMHRMMLSYTHVLLSQIAQTSACNSVHSVVQRFCRWLLVCSDRLDTMAFPATQELVAGLLGVRRESVNHVASGLQNAGILRSTRGHIQILDPARLEAQACECHAVIRQLYLELLDPASNYRLRD